MSEPTPEAIEAAVAAAAKYLAGFDGTGANNWEHYLVEAKELLEAAAPHIRAQEMDSRVQSLEVELPYLIREAQAQALEQVAEEWEAMVRREKPPVRGYNFLRTRAAAIRDGHGD